MSNKENREVGANPPERRSTGLKLKRIHRRRAAEKAVMSKPTSATHLQVLNQNRVSKA
jgi:hypothetical protein